MPTKEQNAWILNVMGVDVGALVGAGMKVVQSLPGSPMPPDCKPVKGKVPGPPHHLLCATHGHVVDIKERKIVAVSLQQYKSQNMGSAEPEHSAAPAKGAPPPQLSAAAAPIAAPSNGAATIVDSDAAKLQAQSKRISTLMQSEVEAIESLVAQYEELAGGSRANRAISWISDKLGGADDPGDELAKIHTQMLIEQQMGMMELGQKKLDAAGKICATMQFLNQKAEVLFKQYSNDTGKGAGRTVSGLQVVSEAGDVATAGLNVVAPGVGTLLSVEKNVAVTDSKLIYGEKVNWTDFTIDMAFDLIPGVGNKAGKLAEKIVGPLAKNLAPGLAEAIAKRWGVEAAAKKLGAAVSKEAIEKYIVKRYEEKLKDAAKDWVTPIAERAVEALKGSDVTHGELEDLMLKSLSNPSGELGRSLSEEVMADFKP